MGRCWYWYRAIYLAIVLTKSAVKRSSKPHFLDSNQVLESFNSELFEFSFCGPETFGDSLKSGLVDVGLPAKRFHREAFKMR